MIPLLFLGGIFINEKPYLLLIKRIYPYCIIVALLIGLRSIILESPFPSNIPFIDNPVAMENNLVRIATALDVFRSNIYLLAFPLELSIDYSFPQVAVNREFFSLSNLITLSLLLISIVMIFQRGKYRKEVRIGLALFIFPFLIISNILLPIGTIKANRLMYIPSAGYCLLISYILLKIKGKIINKPLFTILIIVVVMIFSLRIMDRNYDWKNEYEIYKQDIRVSPRSVKLNNNLAYHLAQKGERLEKALIMVDYALGKFPYYGDALDTKGWILFKLGRYSESLTSLEQALKLMPENQDIKVHINKVRKKIGSIRP